MKAYLRPLLLIALLAAIGAAAEPSAQFFELNLDDGSRLLGRIPSEQLCIASPILGAHTLDTKDISTIIRNEGPSPRRVTLTNGDQLHCQFIQTAITFETMVGVLKLPITSIDKVTRAPTPDWTATGVVERRLAAPPKHNNRPSIDLVVTTRDGSLIIAQAPVGTLRLVTAFAELDMALSKISRIEMKSAEVGTLEMVNGDRISGVFQLPKLQTKWARIVLPAHLVKSIRFRHRSSINFEVMKHRIYSSDSEAAGPPQILTFTGSSSQDISAPLSKLSRYHHSIAVWCRPTAAALKGKATIFSNWHREVLRLDDGKPSFYIPQGQDNAQRGSAYTTLASPNAVRAGEWIHLVATVNSGGKARLYVDGKMVSEANINKDGAAWYKRNFLLGVVKDFNAPHHYYTGDLAGVQIFNHVLDDDEVAVLYNNHVLPERVSAVITPAFP